MYKDIEKKLNYHKNKLIKEFINKGIFPSDNLIQSRINNIELRLAILEKPIIKEGSIFNTKEMNYAIEQIADDLNLLYEILYEVTEKEYNDLNRYVRTHLLELEELSDMYLKRAELESLTTALGKSIIFKHNDFIIDTKDGVSVIDIGQASIEDASKIACIANINNVAYEDVIFELYSGDKTLSCNAYNYNHDTLITPGEKNRTLHEIKLKESQKITGLIELPLDLKELKDEYTTMAGKDKILYKKANVSGEIIEEKPVAINALSFKDHSYIDFYVVKGSGISFKFNKKPIAANFDINIAKIEKLDFIHHFFIECDENFSFDFELESGYVYAIKEKTLIDKDKIFYSGNIDVKEFLVVETENGSAKNYNISIEIQNSNITEDDIESVMIKKIK